MAILKHTFDEMTLKVVDGEIQDVMEESKDYYFSLRMNGMKLFEMEYGKPLLKSFTSVLQNIDLNKLKQAKDELGLDDSMLLANGILDEKFLRALASASYVKLEGNQIYNNEATMQEFKESYAYSYMMNDLEFVIELLQMAFDNTFEKKKKKDNGSSSKN